MFKKTLDIVWEEKGEYEGKRFIAYEIIPGSNNHTWREGGRLAQELLPDGSIVPLVVDEPGAHVLIKTEGVPARFSKLKADIISLPDNQNVEFGRKSSFDCVRMMSPESKLYLNPNGAHSISKLECDNANEQVLNSEDDYRTGAVAGESFKLEYAGVREVMPLQGSAAAGIPFELPLEGEAPQYDYHE